MEGDGSREKKLLERKRDGFNESTMAIPYPKISG